MLGMWGLDHCSLQTAFISFIEWINHRSSEWVSKWNLTPFSELDALDLKWKTHGLIFCILLSVFTLIFIHYSDIFRYQIVSCHRCSRRQQNSRSVNLKNPNIVKNLTSKLAVHVRKGHQFSSLRPALKTFLGGPGNELLQIWVCHCMAGNSPVSMYISVISVVCRTSWIHKFRLNQLFS